MARPRHFGRYEVLGIVGEGSMGRVYRAFDPLGQRTVAVKTLHTEHLAGSESSEYVERFRREAQAAGALQHPNIVSIFDVGEDYFVMELLEGITLQQLLAERGTLRPEEMLAVLGPIASALEYGHARGTIHRDLTPSNIMVLPNGCPKLMDFGVAHLSSRPITDPGRSLGSPQYMAPEQVERGLATPRADLFSLAVLAYEALTGHNPFDAPSVVSTLHRVVSADALPPRQYVPDLPRSYDSVFARALAKRPERRHSGPLAFVEQLGFARPAESSSLDLQALAQAPTTTFESTPTVTVAEPGPRSRRFPTRRRLTLCLAVVLVSAAGLWLAGGDQTRQTRSGLRVRTRPPGARVEIDGKVRGVSPIDIGDLPAGVHRVRLEMADYAPTELRLTLTRGMAPVPLLFDLVPRPEPAPPPERPPSATLPPPPVTLPTGLLPVRVAGSLPAYPDAARALHLEGTVTVDMVIDEEGHPTRLWVRQSAGKILDRAVLSAIRGWRYAPTVRDGRPVRVWHRYRQVFQGG